MPQSRQRKTGKTRKRNKGLYAPTKSKPPSDRNKQIRIIAIVVVVLLAAGTIFYLVRDRNGGSAHEVTTPSGLKYTDLVVGTGPTPQRGQMVSVHYTGTLENGFKFDSSRDKGAPMEYRFGIQPMIKGWDEGLSTMKVGGRRKLVIPGP
ncbi:MAG TPA: FKBP-type peptidyl-prolyl cis-trans isomerase, partial [Pyrinomonadaceae bacterium]|nr:FKBP-type peptidyl-prolyl cis-trans isomerase [Pyrinomonadaceae bacterium]